MLRRIAALAAPRVVLLAARALAAQHVRPSASLAGIVNRLMDVDGDAVLGGRLHDLAVMPHHVLACMGVTFGGFVVHVAGLDGIDAERAV